MCGRRGGIRTRDPLHPMHVMGIPSKSALTHQRQIAFSNHVVRAILTLVIVLHCPLKYTESQPLGVAKGVAIRERRQHGSD